MTTGMKARAPAAAPNKTRRQRVQIRKLQARVRELEAETAAQGDDLRRFRRITRYAVDLIDAAGTADGVTDADIARLRTAITEAP